MRVSGQDDSPEVIDDAPEIQSVSEEAPVEPVKVDVPSADALKEKVLPPINGDAPPEINGDNAADEVNSVDTSTVEEPEAFKQWNEARPDDKKVDFSKLHEDLSEAILKAETPEEVEKIVKAFNKARAAANPAMQTTTVGALLGNSIASAIIGTTAGVIEASKMIGREFTPSNDRSSVVAAEMAVNAVKDADVADTLMKGVNSRNRDSLVDIKVKDINAYSKHVVERGEMLAHDFAVMEGLGANAVEEFKAAADRARETTEPSEELVAELERQHKDLQTALTRSKQIENDKDELGENKKHLDQSIDNQREELETIMRQVVEFLEKIMNRLFGIGRNKKQQDKDREEEHEESRQRMGAH